MKSKAWFSTQAVAVSLFCAVIFSITAAQGQTMRQYSGFPSSTSGEQIVFDSLGSGRILAWDGTSLFLQTAPGEQSFTPFPIGISGDPAFLCVAPDGDTVVLGAGGTAGDTYAGEISSFSVNTSTETLVLATIENHRIAEFVTDTQLLVARRASGETTDELMLFDTTGDTITPTAVLTNIPGTVNAIAVDFDGAEVFVGIAEGELRTFARTALLNAESGSPVDWNTGSLLSGGFGGAATVLTDNDLLVLGGNGLLSLVNKNNLTVIRDLDPAGQETGNYTPGFNAGLNEILAMHQLGAVYSLYAFDTPASCFVRSIRIATPVDRSTIYGNRDAGNVHIPLTIDSECLGDIAAIDYSLVLTEPTPIFLGSATEAPFLLDSGLRFVNEGDDVQADFIADGIAVSDENFTFSDEVRVTVSSAISALDTDGNGLPDQPYAVLDHPGDRWMTGETLPGGTYIMTTGVAVLYGYDPFTDIYDPDWEPEDDEHGFNDIRMVVTNDENSSQSVEVTASEFLLDDDEIGLLIVQVAADLPSLLGTEGAEFIDSVPRGDLEGDGIYVHIAFLVSDDEGESFTEVRSSRLNDNPIRVIVKGQPLEDGIDYALRRYPTTIIDSDNGIEVLGENGSWRTLPEQTVNPITGNFEVELTSLPVVFAPFEGTVSPGGGDGSGSLEGLFAILYAGLVALGLAGGSGGGDPCFIATAAYGTPISGDIDVLREFRDTYLLTSSPGTAFVDLYYRISPTLADHVAARPALAAIVRTLLTPIILGIRLLLSSGSTVVFIGLSLSVILIKMRNIMTRKPENL